MTSWFPEAWGHVALKNFCQVVTKSFFREQTLIGGQKVPAYGPIIYYGNHSNQFVDAAVFITSLPRYPRFLIAEVSLHAPVIGDLAKMSGAIPVTRPGDSQFNGLGVISIESQGVDENGKYKYRIKGDGSDFKTDALKVRDQIVIKVTESHTFSIEEIQFKASNDGVDEAICVSSQDGLEKLITKTHPYKVIPKVDQTQAYNAVNKTLAEGGSIGIFPEGGSHDNTNLLPLKPGIAVMALNAAVLGIKNIMLVPCGIHYSNPEKVMSSYTVEINKPVIITEEIVEHYRKDKRAAVAHVMELVKDHLEQVVITATDQEQFDCIRLASSLFPPEGAYDDSKQVKTELIHILERCFREFKDRTEFKTLSQIIVTYKDMLTRYNIQDRHVTYLRLNSSESLIKFIELMPSFFFSSTVAIFTCPLWFPARLVSSYYADMKRSAALKKSTVKVRGSDVVASHKLIFLLVLLPVLMLTWSTLFGLYVYGTFYGTLMTVIFGMMIQPGLYYFGIKEADKLVNKFGQVSSLLKVIRDDVVTWRRDINVLLTSREAVVLKLRATLSKVLSEDTQFSREQRDRLEFIYPQELMNCDSKRLEDLANGTYLPTYTHLDASEWGELVGFSEEIL